MNLQTYHLPKSWTCALFYGDHSGVSDKEVKAIEAMESSIAGPDGTAVCVSVEGDDCDFRRWHDASDVFPFACDVAEFIFDVEAAA